jgi:hypothetical protein
LSDLLSQASSWLQFFGCSNLLSQTPDFDAKFFSKLSDLLSYAPDFDAQHFFNFWLMPDLADRTNQNLFAKCVKNVETKFF